MSINEVQDEVIAEFNDFDDYFILYFVDTHNNLSLVFISLCR